MPGRSFPDGRLRARIGVALVVFAYLAILRTRHISETFWLLDCRFEIVDAKPAAGVANLRAEVKWTKRKQEPASL